MATFFGEVVHQSSRAFWDGCEDDEDADAEKGPVFQLKKLDHSENENYDLIIFSSDKTSTEFSSLCFLPDESKLIATIQETEQNNMDNRRQPKQVAKLYQITCKILLLVCTSDIRLVDANELLILVAPWLKKTKEAIVLATSPIGEYKSFKSGKVLQSSFLRSLWTRTYKDSDVLCPRLECPNALTGFSAAVLSWCQVKDKPCVLYVYYYVSSLPINNTIDVQPLYKLFEKLQWYKQLCSDKKLSYVKSIKLHNHLFQNSNLYL